MTDKEFLDKLVDRFDDELYQAAERYKKAVGELASIKAQIDMNLRWAAEGFHFWKDAVDQNGHKYPREVAKYERDCQEAKRDLLEADEILKMAKRLMLKPKDVG